MRREFRGTQATPARDVIAAGALLFFCGTNSAIASQTPLSGAPIPVPSTWEAEDFDLGGEGIAYHDNVPGNAGAQYRTSEDVDIVASWDSAGGGHVVNNFEAGEWIEYTIDVPTSGLYNIEIRTSNLDWSPAPKFRVEIVNRGDVTGEVTVPTTGSWTTFAWVASNGVYLDAGTQVLRIVAVEQYFNLNSIRITPTPNPSPFNGTPIPVPSTWEAEDFDRGGEGVAYHDSVSGNAGGQYRTTEDVDIIGSGDAEGGAYVVNSLEAGEWLVYTINVATSGWYELELRAATNVGFPDSAFRVAVDGVNATGTVVLPDTGDWNNYQWTGKKTLLLSAGTHVLKVASEQQHFDLNRIRLTAAPPPPTSLLFWSGYEPGVELGPPTECWGTGCWQHLTGADNSTGYTWPPPVWEPGGFAGLQLLVDAAAEPGTISTYMVNQLDHETGRNGSRSLYSEIKQSGCCGTEPQLGGVTQDPHGLGPPAEPSGAAGDLYLSYWLKLQPDLTTLMGQCDLVAADHLNLAHQWRMVFAWKTAGDYRVTLQVQRDRDPSSCAFIGPLYWSVAGDNEANCNFYTPPPGPGMDCPTAPTNTWSEQDRSVAVPEGQWFKLEVFWHRSSGTDGRVWMAVDGQVIVDHQGPNTGSWNAPIDRIMVSELYTSTHYPVYQWVDDLQIWSSFPTVSPGDPWYDAPYAPH